jgi:uncharacterized protein
MIAQRAASVAAIVLVCSASLGAQAHAGTPAAGSNGSTASTITVTGNGTATGTPDELQLSLEVDSQASSVSDALDAANQDMTQVRDALLKSGVPAAALQTTGMDIQPQYDQNSKITGYTVTESLSAELHGLATAGQAITDAANAGGNATRIDGVQLDLTDQSARLLAAARADAFREAQAQAEQYARAAGRKLGTVLSITDEGSTGISGPVLPAAMFVDRAAVPISAGSAQLTASVAVVWQLSLRFRRSRYRRQVPDFLDREDFYHQIGANSLRDHGRQRREAAPDRWAGGQAGRQVGGRAGKWAGPDRAAG